MATVTASLFSALDGVVDPMIGAWHFPYFNDQLGKAVTETHDTDVMLFGRVTYDSFAGAWPERETAGGDDAPMAKRLGDMRKLVVSRSPLDLTWRNSEQVNGDLVDTVRTLKADDSIRRVALSGSVSVVRQLLDAGLLDELHLFVHPVAAGGGGLHLFDPDGSEHHFELVSATPFKTGIVWLVYRPNPNPPTGGYEEATQHIADA
jgi:dihydrofolate reductase